jgi:hypothetical protein
MSNVAVPNIPDLIKEVQQLLDAKCRRRKFRLKVSADGVREDDDWIIIAVPPTKPGVRAYEYAELLNEVEEELHARGIEKVVLWPVLAD